MCDDRLRADPDDVDALFTRGVLLARILEYRRALRCIDWVAEIDPVYPGVWRPKAIIHRNLGGVHAAEDSRRQDEAA